MIELTFVCDDQSDSHLAQEYWLIDADEEWIFSIRQLAVKHGVASSKLVKTVRKVCTARATTIKCTCCHTPVEVDSRSAFQALRRSENRLRIMCDSCQADARSKLARARVNQLDQERLAIETWINSQINQLLQKDYAVAPKEEVFLLYGLLGETWNNNELQAWETHQPQLFAHVADTEQTYVQLCSTGWIAPSNTSKRQAFTVNGSRLVSLDPMKVNWVLATCPTVSDQLEILPLLHHALKEIAEEDLRAIWYRVCLSELRAYFEEVHDRFRFKSDGWTPLVQTNMKMLLQHCSLAEAKGLVWFGLKNLVTAREDRKNPVYLIKNWIPGCFMRTYERNKEFGPLKQWDRPPITSECVYTSLLFDTILRGKKNPYGTLKGADLG
jgi:hypothetical protein